MFRSLSVTSVPTGQVHIESIEILQELLPFSYEEAFGRVVKMGLTPERSRNVHTRRHYAVTILGNSEEYAKLLQEDRFPGEADLDLCIRDTKRVADK